MSNNKLYNREIYATRRWQQLRKAVLQRDKGLCQNCLKNGKYKTGNEVDHIIALAENGHPWDINNLQLLCSECHIEKTRLEHKKNRTKDKHPSTTSWVCV